MDRTRTEQLVFRAQLGCFSRSLSCGSQAWCGRDTGRFSGSRGHCGVQAVGVGVGDEAQPVALQPSVCLQEDSGAGGHCRGAAGLTSHTQLRPTADSATATGTRHRVAVETWEGEPQAGVGPSSSPSVSLVSSSRATRLTPALRGPRTRPHGPQEKPCSEALPGRPSSLSDLEADRRPWQPLSGDGVRETPTFPS